ncbi:unnamed protein product [Brassica rapa subsp. trilocularis]
MISLLNINFSVHLRHSWESTIIKNTAILHNQRLLLEQIFFLESTSFGSIQLKAAPVWSLTADQHIGIHK